MNKKDAKSLSSSRTISDLYAQAAREYQAGQYDVARKHLDRILRKQPQNIAALNFVAIIAARVNRPEEAEIFLRRILRFQPDDHEVHNNLGAVLARQGKAIAAEAAYREALRLRPHYPDAGYNLGKLLHQCGRLEEAESHYRSAIQLGATASALTGLGLLLKSRRLTDEAEQCFVQAIRANPKEVAALNGLAQIREESKRYAEAETLFRKALEINPASQEVLGNLGGLLFKSQRWREAEGLLRDALRTNPDAWEILINLGVTLHALHRLHDAEQVLRQVVRLNPAYAPGYRNLALVLKDRGQIVEARQLYEHLHAKDPVYCAEKRVLGDLAEIYMTVCDWPSLSHILAKFETEGTSPASAVAPFTLMALLDQPDVQLSCAQSYTQQHYSAPPLIDPPIYNHDHAKIRVAYLSGDFRDHAVGHLIQDVFQLHDHSLFEITAVAFGPDSNDPIRDAFIRNADRFMDVRFDTDANIASRLRELEIDIAVDLSGFTAHSRTGILALRPAPIQVNYLGFPGSMGAAFMDYVIADMTIIPETTQAAYSESVVYLPDTFLPTSRWDISDATPPRDALNLPEGAFVFCCFNNTRKLTPALFDIWMRLLAGIDDSVLWLASSTRIAESNLRGEAAARGIQPERLVFAPKLPLADHLARHRQANLFLDTLPVNAITTSADALWAGLPVLTCSGTSYPARACTSLLQALGLPELAVSNLQDYESLARRLATQPTELKAIREKLARHRSCYPLFDTHRYTRNLEAAYRTMHAIRQRGEPPHSFTVETGSGAG
jgi:predicted O-linked N-acetylglucosamine transferase (SPINDLY family)